MSDFIIESGILKKYVGEGGDVVIPDGVKEVGESAFENCKGLTSVVLPSGVTQIGACAFRNCSNLARAKLPNGVTKIGSFAFGGTNLRFIKIPGSVTKIGVLAIPGKTKKYKRREKKKKSFKIRFGTLVKYTGTDGHAVVPDGVTKIGSGAFVPSDQYEKNILFSVSLPNSVKKIGKSAFKHCTWLTSVTIPDGVTKIGDSAFENCSLLSVTIPDGVTEIGDSAFENCNLLSVTIPKSVKKIGNSAFAHCKNLTSVTIPGSVKRIGKSAFIYCHGLTSVTFSDGITKIPEKTFSCCENLTSVSIPNSVRTIKMSAFSYCNNLSVICSENSYAHRYCEENHISFLFDYQYEAFHGTLPPGLEMLKSPFPADEEKPFVFVSYSHKDRDRVLPVLKALYEAGWKIWYDEGLTIGDSYDETLERHVKDCSAFLLFVTRNSLASRYIEKNEVPWAKRFGKPIVRCTLDEGAEYEIADANIVGTVPPGELGQTLDKVEGLAKGEEREAKGIVVPVDPAVRGDAAAGENYAYCLYAEASAPNAKTILRTVVDGGAIVYDAAQEGESEEKLRESNCLIVFLDPTFLSDSHLTGILAEAYRSGRDIAVCLLEDVTLPPELEGLDTTQWLHYGHGVQSDLNKKLMLHLEKRGCRNLSVIPGFTYEKTERGIVITGYTSRDPHPVLEREYGGVPVVAIGPRAFENRNYITEFVIPNGVTEIGIRAFFNCSSLTSVVIPKGVTEIGGAAFANCTSLTSVSIPVGVTKIDGFSFYNCTSLTSATLPVGITEIGFSAFSNCESLTSFTVPDGVTKIKGDAFTHCKSLTSIMISDSVTEIGRLVFDRCINLTSISIPDSVTKIGDYAFFSCRSLTAVTLPGSVIKMGESVFRGMSLTVTCPAGSYAEEYCKKNKVPYRTEP